MNRSGVMLASLALILGAAVGAAQEQSKPESKPPVPMQPAPTAAQPMPMPMPPAPMATQPMPPQPTDTQPPRTMPRATDVPGEAGPVTPPLPSKRPTGVYTPLPYHQVYPPPAPVLRDPRTGAGRQQLVPPNDPVEQDIVIPVCVCTDDSRHYNFDLLDQLRCFVESRKCRPPRKALFQGHSGHCTECAGGQ